MDVPDFTRAEYHEPVVIDAYPPPNADARLPQALVYGVGAAVVGAVGYAVVGLSGFMVSIVAIGMAWLIAKAMMSATGGVGGRHFQIAAVVLTYFSVTLGQTMDSVWFLHGRGLPVGLAMSLYSSVLLKQLLLGPFLRGFSGIIGLVIVGIGMRQAWVMAAGSPVFSSTQR